MVSLSDFQLVSKITRYNEYRPQGCLSILSALHSESADKQINKHTNKTKSWRRCSTQRHVSVSAWCYLCDVPHLLPQGLYYWAISGYVSAYVVIDSSPRALNVCVCVGTKICLRGIAYPVSCAAGAVWPLCGCNINMNVWSCMPNGL